MSRKKKEQPQNEPKLEHDAPPLDESPPSDEGVTEDEIEATFGDALDAESEPQEDGQEPSSGDASQSQEEPPQEPEWEPEDEAPPQEDEQEPQPQAQYPPQYGVQPGYGYPPQGYGWPPQVPQPGQMPPGYGYPPQGGAPQYQPQQPAPQQEPEPEEETGPYITEENFADVISSPEALNSLLQKVKDDGRRESLREARAEVQRAQVAEKARTFWQQNPDLVPLQGVVNQEFNRIASVYPNAAFESVAATAANVVRQNFSAQLDAWKQQQEQMQMQQAQQTGFQQPQGMAPQQQTRQQRPNPQKPQQSAAPARKPSFAHAPTTRQQPSRPNKQELDPLEEELQGTRYSF